jgi:ribosomal protein S18 acetylase RimI-like enzyme
MPSQISATTIEVNSINEIKDMTASPTSKPAKQSFSIRPALPQDAAQIISVGSSTFTKSFGHSLSPQDLATYLSTSYSISAITSEIQNPFMKFFVAYLPSNPDEVLGFAQLTSNSKEPVIDNEPERFPKPIELQRFYVGMEWAGKGIGKLLINEVERTAREMGRETFWLGVW